jgi:hypothetical protein
VGVGIGVGVGTDVGVANSGVAVGTGIRVGVDVDVGVAETDFDSRVEMADKTTAVSNAAFAAAVCSADIRAVASMSTVDIG